MAQFFLPEHYSAFDSQYSTSDSQEADRRRAFVRDRLLELDNQIWPLIESRNALGLWDLNRHWQKNHHTSTFFIIPHMVDIITSMWLHYGKSKDRIKEFNEYAFYCHTRIQPYIGIHPEVGPCVRMWLISTDKDYYDRRVFLERIFSKPDEAREFYVLLRQLFGKGYFYEIDGKRHSLEEPVAQEDIMQMLKKCKRGTIPIYSGIVKEYSPDDPLISEDNIAEEMWNGIADLYPLYEFMIRGT